jgi:glycosyltransferase involved in cell wall biosynthesis
MTPLMKIVFIAASTIPSDTANSIQVMKVCQAFAQLGHQVHLLVPGVRPENADADALMRHYGLERSFEIEWLGGVNRRIFPWQAAWRARRLGAELIYCWPIQSAVIGRLIGLPCMLELHDLPGGKFGPLWLKLLLRLRGKKRLLPITAALSRALALPPAQTLVAPDGVDLERYSALPSAQEARQRCGLPQKPTVLCTGHLYAGRGAGLFLSLAGSFPAASFVWVGGRPADVETWQARAGAAHLDNLSFTGFQPNELMPLYQSAADVLLMPYERKVATSSGGDTAQVCSPMKMFEYMAAGRAILTSDLPVLHEVLDENMAVFCPPESGGEWESALGSLLDDPARRQSLGEHARQAAQRYSWIERARNVLQGWT